MATRVQIPAYTDRWMMGDRYGTIVRIKKAHPANAVRASLLKKHRWTETDIAHVKLDKSGKTVRVYLDDCTEI